MSKERREDQRYVLQKYGNGTLRIFGIKIKKKKEKEKPHDAFNRCDQKQM
jgi:hypothetical protein